MGLRFFRIKNKSPSISSSEKKKKKKRLIPLLFTLMIVIISIVLIHQTLLKIRSQSISSPSSILSSSSSIFFSATSNLKKFLSNSEPDPNSSSSSSSSSSSYSDRKDYPYQLRSMNRTLPFFDSIRVVSLKSRPDRRNHMKRLDEFLNLNLKFSDAILYDDPRVIETVKRVGRNTKADKKIAEVGHVACRMSHRLAIEACDKDDDEISLILEDDVDIEVAFKYLAGTILRDVPKDWDMIFFGHTDFSDESKKGRVVGSKNFFIYKSVEPQGGHGYALSRKGRKLILDLLYNRIPNVYSTDEGQPIDEIFMYMIRLGKIDSYSIIPDLIVQRSIFKSDIFGTPAGFEDGMHNKILLDSSLELLNSLSLNKSSLGHLNGSGGSKPSFDRHRSRQVKIY